MQEPRISECFANYLPGVQPKNHNGGLNALRTTCPEYSQKIIMGDFKFELKCTKFTGTPRFLLLILLSWFSIRSLDGVYLCAQYKLHGNAIFARGMHLERFL